MFEDFACMLDDSSESRDGLFATPLLTPRPGVNALHYVILNSGPFGRCAPKAVEWARFLVLDRAFPRQRPVNTRPQLDSSIYVV
jgi:hypothetical protein